MVEKKLLNEEFKSLGFFISDHPLNEYKGIFNQLSIISYKDFFQNDKNEGLVAGTVMSIQEKKSSKGTPFAIVKFSDQFGEFELFLFSEILIKNREFLKEGESFILTLLKDINNNKTQQRINVKKILSVNEMVNSDYKKMFRKEKLILKYFHKVN